MAAIEDANGVVTKAGYNAIGQRMSVNDPNQGSWGFAYNALGEVQSQSDARGITTAYAYDKLGRPTAREATLDVTGDGQAERVWDTWGYDPANARGQMASSHRMIGGQTERQTVLSYDSVARPIQSDVTQALATGTQSYRTRTRYDSYYGRPAGQEFPNGEAVEVVYTQYGEVIAEKEPASGIEYRRSNSVNARGQTTQETFGNAVVLAPTYQLQTGQLTGLSYSGASGNLRTLGYGYDVFGNVKRQSLNGGASREDYSYDQLHRLVQSIRSGAASGTVDYGYDAVGNIAKKSDFSSNVANAYSYSGGSCGGGANAVKSVQLAAGGSRTYCYDANGNLTGDNAGLSLKYDHQNLPVVAQRGALRDDFRYGADGQRTRSWGSDGARVYLPGYEHRTDTGETKVYIGDYAVISRTGATRKVEYLLKDRLGSVDAVANASGSVIETRGYDAFGKPRNGTWNDLSPAKIASTAVTPKGFTQHEHLNQLELIHMNGRAYDYNLGRFTGVDPFIQFPLNSQSLNPYSYILNNPLSGTDPTGYESAATQDCKNASKEGPCTYTETGSRIKKQGTIGSDSKGNATFTGPGAVGGKLITSTGSVSAYGEANGASGRQGAKGIDGSKDHSQKIWTESTRVNIEGELSARGARRSEINSISSGCAGYTPSGPKVCGTTDRLFNIVKTGQAAGTDDSGGGDVANPKLVGRLDFNENGGMELSETYSYKGISDQAAKNFESRVESAWGSHGGNVDLRRAGEGETPDLMLSGITNRQMADNLNLCSCMAGAFIGAHSQSSGVININMGTPLPQHMTMPEHELVTTLV